jgi:hypothetical protein
MGQRVVGLADQPGFFDGDARCRLHVLCRRAPAVPFDRYELPHTRPAPVAGVLDEPSVAFAAHAYDVAV